jgi:class 3 adenylate cyclase
MAAPLRDRLLAIGADARDSADERLRPLGDTVNMASRMQTHGTPDEIQVTRSTRELLNDHFLTEPIGLVDVKGKATTETWLIGPRG